ncbi:MAG: SsrA-binding protein SmpB [Microgenomates group bacterium]
MKIYNRKFRREYQEIERYEAGIVLLGAEVKSIREGRIKLDDSFVKIMEDGAAYLINADIPLYKFSHHKNYDSKRRRKLLLHKRELVRLKTKISSSKGLTIVPVSCYNKGNLIKIEVALARGRKDIEKGKLEKQRDIKREQEKEAKGYLRS